MKKTLLLLILPVLFFATNYIQAQTVINSLAELQSHLDTDDGNFVMTPGTYYFNTDNCGPGKQFSDPRLLLFTGNNCTYDFTGVKFEIDTEIFTLYGNIDVLEFWPVGSNNTYKNLTLEDIGMTVPTKGATTLHLDGSDNVVEGFKTTTRGSFPYGYGDTFGKGGGSVIGHNKHAGMLVRGDRNKLLNCTVIMRAYGHGIFVQGSHDAVIEGCYVEGELRTVGKMLQEEGTDSPADNVDFWTVWGFDLRNHTSDYTFSLQEAGIRAYSTGVIFDSDGNSTGVSRGTENTTVIDCTIVKMRVGVNTGAEGGDNKRIENCTALACEGGFWLGNDGDVINCFADASVGPILSEDISRSNATYEVTILDNYVPKIGDTPYFFMGGTNHNITIHDGTTYYNPDIEIVLGGTRPANRFLEGSSGDTPPSRNADNITLTNNTRYPLVLESASGCTIYSCGPVSGNTSGNTIGSAPTGCDYERDCDNTADNLQAECYDTMNGIGTRVIDAVSNNDNKEIYALNNGEWINFNGIDLTGAVSINVTAASSKNNVALEVREGSETGNLLATIAITDNSATHSVFSASVDLSSIVDVTNVDLYFVGVSSDTGWLFTIDKLSFKQDTCATALYNPFLPISAEDFCESSGITVDDLSVFNQVITNIDSGDYLRFSNVDFGNYDVYNSIEILASSALGQGSIEVRSGAIDGTLLSTIPVQSTGNLDDYSLFTGDTAGNLSGIHDIYLVFIGTGSTLLNIDNIYFNHDTCSGITYNAYSQIEAEDYCDMFGVSIVNNIQVGGINDGEWIRFGNVDFTSTSPDEVTLSLGGETAGGYVNIMLDHPEDGTMIATTAVPDTGDYSNFEEFTVSLNQEVTGTHEVYFYFGNGGFDMNWFEFHEETLVLDNLALASNGGVASQSSTAHDGVASRANDGDTNGNFGGGSVAHTEDSGEGILKWWEVDLGENKSISEIVIYNRTGSDYSERLNNFTIEIKNDNGDITYSQLFVDYPNPSSSININNVTGRIVRISKTSNRALTIAEVEVYGTNVLSLDHYLFEQIKLYPNPATNDITINNAAGSTIEIFNINGVMESTFKVLENKKVITIEHLNSGIHFIKFNTDQGSTVRKLIKL